ncbi:MAG: hypothetical protein JSU00_30235 [Acidobacteria bacterium]|nr:hypothetical protein [Acidobacteriota bacterium]
MSLVQLLLQTESYARDLTALLNREGCNVVRATAPDYSRPGPIVADRRALERFPELLEHPDRVVLIAPNDPNYLSLLWRHNVRSVVFDTDSPSTVMLAILGMAIGQGVPAMRPHKSNLVVLSSR